MQIFEEFDEEYGSPLTTWEEALIKEQLETSDVLNTSDDIPSVNEEAVPDATMRGTEKIREMTKQILKKHFNRGNLDGT